MPKGKAGSGKMLGDGCVNCGIILDATNCVFKSHHLQPRCIECHRTHTSKMPSRSKEARAATYMAWKWNLSAEEFKKKLDFQLGGCAICKQPDITGKALAVDHNHETGKIRDLLCYRCNQVLGAVLEDEEILFAMIEYLKRHNESKVA